MKDLQEYAEKSISELLLELGAFFAFNNPQYKEGCKDGVLYISMGNGLFCPEDKVKDLIEKTDIIYQESIRLRLRAFGLEKIIEYELINYECFYLGEVPDNVYSLLLMYGAKKKDVDRVFYQLIAKKLNSKDAKFSN